jgi:hypothetical protein
VKETPNPNPNPKCQVVWAANGDYASREGPSKIKLYRDFKARPILKNIQNLLETHLKPPNGNPETGTPELEIRNGRACNLRP